MSGAFGTGRVDRRTFVRALLSAGSVAAVMPRALRAANAPLTMTVYKTPTCGCCKNWVSAAKSAGFDVKVIDLADLAEIKRNAGVPEELQSCHTALSGKYVFEGHVPLDLVTRVLSEQPRITGLAVPGMPVGSQGMEQGNAKQPYAVMAFTRGGTSSVYAKR